KSIWHPNKSAVLEVDGLIIGQFGYLNPKTIHEFGLDSDLFAFELDSENLKKIKKEVLFTSIPKYPPQVEDITVNILNETNVGDVIQVIKSASKFVSSVSLLEVYQNAYTFRIEYQHRKKTLTDAQV